MTVLLIPPMMSPLTYAANAEAFLQPCSTGIEWQSSCFFLLSPMVPCYVETSLGHLDRSNGRMMARRAFETRHAPQHVQDRVLNVR